PSEGPCGLKVEAPAVSATVRRMEAELEDPPAIARIAADLGLSSRTLEKAFSRALGVTPGRFFRDLRLQEARRLVLDSGMSLQEIAVRTGFAAQATFSRAFAAKFGLSASELRRRVASV
ncbi:MAG: helix-turn-helix domain-containing protein, partial [Halocynthiibacter sp.]